MHGALALATRLQYDGFHTKEWVILENDPNSSANHLP